MGKLYRSCVAYKCVPGKSKEGRRYRFDCPAGHVLTCSQRLKKPAPK